MPSNQNIPASGNKNQEKALYTVEGKERMMGDACSAFYSWVFNEGSSLGDPGIQTAACFQTLS